MERRTFVKNSALLTGAFLIPENSIFGSDSQQIINVGIIGCGNRGRGIIHLLNQLPDKFKVTAVCDNLDFRLGQAKKISEPKTRTYTDYQKLLNDKSVDAVVVALPLNLHYPVAVDVLNSGRHLYLEKTMTYNIEEALALVKLAKQKVNQVLQVGHQYRYSPLYYRVKDMIAKNQLGTISQIECRWDRNHDWRQPVPKASLERQINWRMYKAYSGGLVAELLSHQIDFINWAFDTHPQEIFATGGVDIFKDGRETFDNVQVTARYEGKHSMIGNFGATCGNSKDGFLFKIKGTLGTISLLTNDGVFYPEKKAIIKNEIVDGVTGASKIGWTKDGGIPILASPTEDGTLYAFNEFYTCIQTKKIPDSNVITGARTAISVHLANNALYDKKPMYWCDSYNLS
ncbi:Gfo/Idh/MocA family protein [Pedobacter xixiisoli]|uniref:Predicted dehydrogenase n=1 Tax=Pedobacter xixiisoli TaxID=1476464 RepID=A0A285ZUM4_9SPHI|nr:Gfo/Idh/MocA family oxidoreductase [Pedobacter xixiisoli]SOD13357.1 Predicted dehydrogenase [Pedobacter xixiisoli]